MGPTKEVEEIPVYMFMGFLESGKTTFANETLIDRGFTEGEPTLLLVCEEGIEEYDEEYLKSQNIFVEYLEESNLNTEYLLDLLFVRVPQSFPRIVRQPVRDAFALFHLEI